ncbi:MAG: flavodoxin domain-containing protein [bacterium]|nr:flavodoxin domain-containing protein [bacterium]MDT8367478.1 flavodoxin domain-containing protein [bacterium]
MKGMIVFASKYGSTAEYASLMAQKLGTEALRASEASSDAVSRADFIVLGSPIYAYSVLPEMEAFLDKYQDLLAGKPFAAFVVCGDTLWNPKAGEGGNKNLEKLTRFLPSEPFAVAVLGGRMLMEELDDEDESRILAFYEKIGRETTGFDRMEMGSVDPFIDRIEEFVVSGV